MEKSAPATKGKGQKVADKKKDLGFAPINRNLQSKQDIKNFRPPTQAEFDVITEPHMLKHTAEKAAFYGVNHVEATEEVFKFIIGHIPESKFFMAYGVMVCLPGEYENISSSMGKKHGNRVR